MARHGGTGTAAVFFLNDTTKFLDAHLATAYLEQGAYDCTHHIAQEAIGLDNEDPLVLTYLLPPGLHDTAVVGGNIGVELAEAGEVGIVKQAAGGFIHTFKVGCVEKTHSTVATEGVLGGSDVVMIGARGGTETGVGIGTYRPYTLYGYIGWEQAIELVCHALTVDALFGIEMGYHLHGMYTGIGATGTDYGHLFAQERSECLGKHLLHGDTVGLYLPAVIGCAIIR